MPRPVIVWLTKTSADAAIWTAALSSGRRIVPVHCESVLEVVHAAQLSFANVVYASASRILRSDILFLESRGVSPVIVNPHHAEMPSKKYSTFHSSCMATLSVATTPLLLETKGDAVTRFFEGNDDGISDRKLVVEEVVDNRTVKERIIAWLTRVYLPTGFPDTTTPDYLSFTKYRTIQNLASAIMSVIR